MDKTDELFMRWNYILRSKASEYEHTARRANKTVTAPCLDEICNEMDAFLAGLKFNAPKANHR